MRKTEPRAGHMVRWNPKTDGRYVHTADFELSKEAEARVGRIFGLMAADAAPRLGEAVFAHLEDAVGRGVLEAMRRCPAGSGPEKVFETAVAAVNRSIARLLGEQGIGLEPEFVTAALVAMQGDRMSIAVWGRPSVLLFRRAVSGAVRGFDLLGDDAPSDSRCFGSVIAGPLAATDRLLVSSCDPNGLVTPPKLDAIMAAPEPGASAARLREEFAGNENGPSVAMLALDTAPVRYLEDGHPRVISTESSIADLNRMESRTGEIMSPSAMAALQKSFADTATAAGGRLGALGKRTASKNSGTQTVELPPARKPAGPGFLKRTGSGLLRLVRGIAAGSWNLVKLAASKDRARLPQLAGTRIAAGADSAIDTLNSLSKPQRGLLLAGLATVFALNSSVLAMSWNGRLQEFASAGERRGEEIAHQLDSAEASMLYRDESRARSIMDEAAAAIALLPERAEKDRAIKASLQERLDRSRDALRRSVRLTDPVDATGDAAAIKALADLAAARADGPDAAEVADAAVWNGRVYELIPTQNRIVRRSPGAADRQFYLKDATDVSRGVSMAIDGEVWVLDGQGGVTRLLRGTRVDYRTASVEPALTDAKRIRTAPDSKYLHVLAPGRIVRYDKKTGALVAQYEHPDLAAATDLALTDGGKTAIVTTSGKTLRFTLPE